jgi:hypothetical protein
MVWPIGLAPDVGADEFGMLNPPLTVYLPSLTKR